MASLLTAAVLAAALPPAAGADDTAGDVGAIGAVPVPDETDFWSQPPRLDELDTTVTIDELRRVRGWPAAKRVRRAGAVMVTLHVDEAQRLQLSVVEDSVGIVQHFGLGAAVLRGQNHTFDGNTFPSPGAMTDEPGPIVFAIRAYARADADADDYRQVAVWVDGATLEVAERKFGAKRWKPRLRLRFDRGTTFRGIGTTYPH